MIVRRELLYQRSVVGAVAQHCKRWLTGISVTNRKWNSLTIQTPLLLQNCSSFKECKQHNLSSASSSQKLSSAKASPSNSFRYQPLFETSGSKVHTYKRLDDLSKGVSVRNVRIDQNTSKEILFIEPEVLTGLAEHAMLDIAYLLRPSHLQQLVNIHHDPDASPNDRFVSLELLKNACIAAGRVLPSCQDTGTAIILGKKSQHVFTDECDEKNLSEGVFNAYTKSYLRYSQMAPLTMFKEANTQCNLPAQIDLFSVPTNPSGPSFDFLFIAKGGGSANKTYLYQQTKALLNPDSLVKFVSANVKTLGTAACPPYHLAVVIGGLSAELNLKTVKLASCRYLDDLPTSGNELGRAFRDTEWEKKILEITRNLGIGAQFGGKYFCHDVRVIRLPRHGASCPVGIGVSCSADRQAVAKINKDGVFIEKLEDDPGKYLQEITDKYLNDNISESVKIDLNRPMEEILGELSKFPVTTPISLSGPLIVARDIAHAKLYERLKDEGSLPSYLKDHAIYYAGPAKKPEGYSSGSFGPTTAGRMDAYAKPFMQAGYSRLTLAKGNRSADVKDACKKYGGFYLGSIGGPAAALAKNHIKKVEVLEYEELGMEAIWRIEVENFPAFIVIDDKGNDFFEEWLG